MDVLFHIGESRYIITDDGNLFMVSLKKKICSKITRDDVESVLRQGYWQEGGSLSEENKRAVGSLIHSI